MKNLLKYAMLFAAAGMLSMSITACSSDDDNNSSDDGFNIVTTTPIVDQDTYPANTSNHKDKSFGQTAIDNCATLVNELAAANQAIASSTLSSEQEAYLYKVLENIVDKVIVPTYTSLADNTEDLEKTLHGLTAASITQAQIDKACADFKAAENVNPQIRKRKRQDYIAALFNKLGDSCRKHVLLSLDKTAESGKNTYNHHARCDRIKSHGCCFDPHHVYKHTVQKDHNKRKESADCKEHFQGNPEGILCIQRVIPCEIVCHHPGNSYRKTGA